MISTVSPGVSGRLTLLALLQRLLFAAAIGLPFLACAAEAPAYLQQAVERPRVAGEGTFRWFGLKLYDARLWVGKKGYQPGMEAPLALELRYARSLDGDRIAKASFDEIRKLGRGSASQQAAWLAAMQKLFPDVADGDRITSVYQPEQGARFYLNDAPLGDIADPEFGRAFFAIWLAETTSAPSLRTELLKHAGPR